MRRPVPVSTSVRPARNISRRSLPVFGRSLVEDVDEVPGGDVLLDELPEPLPSLRPGFCERPPLSLPPWEPELLLPWPPLLLPPPLELELPLPANGSVYWSSPAPPALCASAPAGSRNEAIVMASATL